jgi:hypothetical protein
VKAVPERLLALGLAVLVCIAALFLLEGRPGRAAAESLQVTTKAERAADGSVLLHVNWRWIPPSGQPNWRGREELLAVSFDTQALAWAGELAPAGTGARGEALRALERAAGPDGARRLFVIPQGSDGSVTVRFLPRFSGAAPEAQPFRVYVASDRPDAGVWMTETAFPGGEGELMTAVKQDF